MSTLVAHGRGDGVPGTAYRSGLREPGGGPGGGSTLEQVLSGLWEDLAARGLAVCPVCGDEMRPRAGRGVPASCRGCCSEFL